MTIAALILKTLGLLVSLISGLSALNLPTREQNKLTRFGAIVLAALLIGTVLSASAGVIDWLANNEQARQQKLAAQALRYTTADATIDLTFSVDKALPDLKAQVERLDHALEYAKAHCRKPGGVAACNDYTIRAVILDELRFDAKSSLFPSPKSDPVAFGIMSKLGVLVRFYQDNFSPSLNLEAGSIAAMALTRDAILGDVLFEYDGFRLRWFVEGKLPAEAFKTVGLLSIVDLLGKGVTARPYARGSDVCPKGTIEHDCDIHLLSLFKATQIEAIDFRFPHRHNVELLGTERGTDNFDVPYVYENLPSRVEDFLANQGAD